MPSISLCKYHYADNIFKSRLNVNTLLLTPLESIYLLCNGIFWRNFHKFKIVSVDLKIGTHVKSC